MIIISKRNFFALIFCFVISIAGLFYAFKVFITKEYDKKLKNSILSELRQEVREIVRSEMNNTYAAVDVKKTQEKAESYAAKPQQADQKHNNPRIASAAPEQDIWGALNHKVRELVNLELDSYKAGQMEAESTVAGGLTKKTTAAGAKSNASADDTKEGITKQNAIERTLVERGGMLLPKGTLQFEPGITLAHFSANKINIEGFAIIPLFIGEVSTQSVKRDIFINTLSLKYGLLNNLQGEVRVPYRYEYDRTTDTTLGTETSLKKGGIGDIECSLSRQIGYEHGMIPDTVFSITAKTITGQDPYTNPIGLGTGHWALRSGLVFVKSSDPAVIFGGLNYTWSAARKFDNFGKAEPGSNIGYTVGAAIALSYQTAINFSFDHNITFRMKRDGRPVIGSFLNSASLKTGFNWALSKNASIDISVSHGLTTDAPDYVFELRFPYTF